MPVIFLCAAMINEAVNRLMRDDAVTPLVLEVSRNLLGRPAAQELSAHVIAQSWIARELEARIPSTSSFADALRSNGLVSSRPDLGGLTVTLEFPAEGTRGSTQGCGNGPYRMACLV